MAARAKVPATGVKSDAYTGILILSLLAQLIGGGFLLWDYMKLTTPKGPPEKVSEVVPSRPDKLGSKRGAAPAPAPAPAPASAPSGN